MGIVQTGRSVLNKTLLLGMLTQSGLLFAELRLRNAHQLKQELGLTQYTLSAQKLGQLKIAILDNDFQGFPQNTDSLPENTEYVRGPLASAPNARQGGHGLLMAQIVWNLLKSRSPVNAPKFYLMQANGFTNFKAAIDAAIAKKVDLILYAANWETGGNFDGQGFLNAEVNRATEAGILWVNAAGNYHRQVFSSPVSIDYASGLVRLPGPKNTLELAVQYTNTPVELTLSWNDYANVEDSQTKKDLDVEILDWTGKVVPVNNFDQGGSRCDNEMRNTRGERKASLHPRENIKVSLDEGLYYLRIIDCSGNFDSTKDRIKLVAQSSKPGALTLKQAQGRQEILPPADNPNVLSVGDVSPISALGPTEDGRLKPDTILPQLKIKMSDGRTFEGGSSVASAAFAATVATLMSRQPSLEKRHLDQYLNYLLQRQRHRGPKLTGPYWQTPSPAELDTLFW